MGAFEPSHKMCADISQKTPHNAYVNVITYIALHKCLDKKLGGCHQDSGYVRYEMRHTET